MCSTHAVGSVHQLRQWLEIVDLVHATRLVRQSTYFLEIVDPVWEKQFVAPLGRSISMIVRFANFFLDARSTISRKYMYRRVPGSLNIRGHVIPENKRPLPGMPRDTSELFLIKLVNWTTNWKNRFPPEKSNLTGIYNDKINFIPKPWNDPTVPTVILVRILWLKTI